MSIRDMTVWAQWSYRVATRRQFWILRSCFQSGDALYTDANYKAAWISGFSLAGYRRWYWVLPEARQRFWSHSSGRQSDEDGLDVLAHHTQQAVLSLNYLLCVKYPGKSPFWGETLPFSALRPASLFCQATKVLCGPQACGASFCWRKRDWLVASGFWRNAFQQKYAKTYGFNPYRLMVRWWPLE